MASVHIKKRLARSLFLNTTTEITLAVQGAHGKTIEKNERKKVLVVSCLK